MPSFLTHNQDNTHTYKVAGDTIQFFCSQAVILALILCNKMVQQQFLRHQAFLFSAHTFPVQFKMYVNVGVVLILLFSLTKQQIQLLHFRQQLMILFNFQKENHSLIHSFYPIPILVLSVLRSQNLLLTPLISSTKSSNFFPSRVTLPKVFVLEIISMCLAVGQQYTAVTSSRCGTA